MNDEELCLMVTSEIRLKDDYCVECERCEYPSTVTEEWVAESCFVKTVIADWTE